jgi:hypothetical protein
MAVDYKKVAGERLKKIRILERRIALARQDIEVKVRDAFTSAIHASCLLSLSDDRVQALVDEAVKKLVGRLNFERED